MNSKHIWHDLLVSMPGRTLLLLTKR